LNCTPANAQFQEATRLTVGDELEHKVLYRHCIRAYFNLILDVTHMFHIPNEVLINVRLVYLVSHILVHFTPRVSQTSMDIVNGIGDD